MKTNNMLIALYFVLSVALLALTRTMADDEEDFMLGEQLRAGKIIPATDQKINQSTNIKEQESPDPTTEPTKTTIILNGFDLKSKRNLVQLDTE